MQGLLRMETVGQVATITMDDGKANVVSPAMQTQLHDALDRAEADGSVVVLAGRPGVFSGGFDLKTIAAGGQEAADMVIGGFELASRLLSFPFPVVIACTGHAVAMGSFLLLCGDYRVGAAGPYRYVANEVAIGMTMPYAAIELIRQRLTPAAFNRAITLSHVFTPDDGIVSGFVDAVAEPAEVVAVATTAAAQFASLPRGAHKASKLRARAATLAALREAIEVDRGELAGLLAPAP